MTPSISEIIKSNLGAEVEVKSTSYLGGGCINHAQKIETTSGTYFLKTNNNVPGDFFRVEEKSLHLLQKYYLGIIPKPIASGTSYLLTDFITSAPKKENYWEKLGEFLAHMHLNSKKYFGLDFDNYIGSLTQTNSHYTKWSDFFVEQRLKPQIKLAQSNNLGDSETWKLLDLFCAAINNFFPEEEPAFIHGDLWSGNLMIDSNGLPALIDPAIHFGNRETELAFTQLFGGFDSIFLKAYDKIYPLQPGFKDRIDLHNLYPLLVHLNLFGNSYLGQIKQILKRIL